MERTQADPIAALARQGHAPTLDLRHQVVRPSDPLYLARRGLDDPELLSAFEVGFVDGTLRATIDDAMAEALKAIGIFNARGREHFLGCKKAPPRLNQEGEKAPRR